MGPKLVDGLKEGAGAELSHLVAALGPWKWAKRKPRRSQQAQRDCVALCVSTLGHVVVWPCGAVCVPGAESTTHVDGNL